MLKFIFVLFYSSKSDNIIHSVKQIHFQVLYNPLLRLPYI